MKEKLLDSRILAKRLHRSNSSMNVTIRDGFGKIGVSHKKFIRTGGLLSSRKHTYYKLPRHLVSHILTGHSPEVRYEEVCRLYKEVERLESKLKELLNG